VSSFPNAAVGWISATVHPQAQLRETAARGIPRKGARIAKENGQAWALRMSATLKFDSSSRKIVA
jgi:hypothetical protein